MEQVIKSFLIGIIIGLMVISIPLYAEVQPIKQGQAAPYDGFIFDKQAEKLASEARNDAAYYQVLSDKLTERSKLQQDENQILEQRLKLYMDSTANLSKEVASRDNNSNLYYLASFSLGVIATSLIVRNLRQ